jgi:hypothetical protein
MIRLVSDAGASGTDFAALMEELVREGELELMDPGAVDEVGWSVSGCDIYVCVSIFCKKTGRVMM